MGHLSTMGSKRLPAKLLHCSVNERKEQRRRQPEKWIDNINGKGGHGT